MHVGHGHFLAVHGARGPADAFVHQCAAEIVGADAQRLAQPSVSHLDPRSLDVEEIRIQRETSDRMHQQRFA